MIVADVATESKYGKRHKWFFFTTDAVCMWNQLKMCLNGRFKWNDMKMWVFFYRKFYQVKKMMKYKKILQTDDKISKFNGKCSWK